MRERLRVLLLRERIHRPQLLAPARQALHPGLERLRVLRRERSGLRFPARLRLAAVTALLALAADPVQVLLDRARDVPRLALRLARQRRKRRQRTLQALGDGAQLLGGLAGLVAQPLGGHLNAGHLLAGGSQACLDPGLLVRALAQLRGDLLAGRAVARQLLLQLHQQGAGPLADGGERRGETLRAGRQRHIRRTAGAQARDSLLARGTF